MHYGRSPMCWEITDFDKEFYPVWVRTPTHTEPVMTPLYCEFWYGYMVSGQRRAADYRKMPTSMGYLWKLYKGHGYLTCALPRESDVPEREKLFKKRSAPILRDIDAAVKANHNLLDELIKPFLTLNPSDMEDGELATHVHDMIQLHNKMIYTYFLGWYSFAPWVLAFQDVLRDVAGIQPRDVEYAHLLGGYMNLLYESNAQLQKLALLAMETGIDDVLLKKPVAEVIASLKESEKGRNWLARLEQFVEVHGFRLLRHYEFCEPGWYENQNLVIEAIRQYAEAGGGSDIEKSHKLRVEERENAEGNLFSIVPESKKEQVKQLLHIARASSYWLESANWLCELRRMAVGRRCFFECGKRMANDKVIDDPNDVFMLFTDEIIHGVANHEKKRYVELAKERRSEWEGYLALTSNINEIPMVIGDPAKIIDLLRTDVTLAVAVSRPPEEEPEKVGAILTGSSGAPGVVEGVVRLIKDEREWNQVKPGDIMVCPMTSSTWTPLFAIIKGLITDSGGDLSHPVIVSREYGIPAVCGTNFATQKLNTGDKVKIDGNKLRVYKR